MMTTKPTACLEIKTSKNNHPIPVLGGVHLHSMYNPQKEAESFTEKNIQLLKDKQNILVLGVGFAYHLEALLDRMNKLNPKKKSHIIVIDPSLELFKACQKNDRLIKSDQIEYICGVEINNLFTNQYFINFLLENPGVIAHPASFSFHKDYFSRFLDYKASTSLAEIQKSIVGEDLREYIEDSGQEFWQELTNGVFNSRLINNDHDFLLMALKGFDSAQHGEINE
jgi:hypothetical protein